MYYIRHRFSIYIVQMHSLRWYKVESDIMEMVYDIRLTKQINVNNKIFSFAIQSIGIMRMNGSKHNFFHVIYLYFLKF